MSQMNNGSTGKGSTTFQKTIYHLPMKYVKQLVCLCFDVVKAIGIHPLVHTL